MRRLVRSRDASLLEWGAALRSGTVGLIVFGVLIIGGWHSELAADEPRIQFVLESSSEASANAPSQDLNSDEFSSGSEREVLAQAAPSQDEVPDAAALYRKGKSLYRAGEYAEAIKYFKQVIALDAEYKGAKNYLEQAQARLVQSKEQQKQAEKEAERLQQEKQLAEQRRQAEQARKRQEDQIKELLSAAGRARKAGDYNQSISLYNQVLALEAGNRKAESGKAKVERLIVKQKEEIEQERARQQQRAEEAKQKAAEEKARQARLAQEQQRKAEEKRAEAEREAQEQKRKAEEEKAREERLAQEQQRKAEEKRAEEERRAEQLRRKAEEERAREARLAQERKAKAEEKDRQEKVKQLLREAKRAAKRDAFDEAVALYGQVLSLDTGNADAIEGRQNAQAEKAEQLARQEREKAEKQQEEAEQKRKDELRRQEEARLAAQQEKEEKIQSLLRTGKSALKSKDYDAAIAAFGQVLQLDPEQSRAQQDLARAQERKQAAVEDARKAALDQRYEAVEALYDQGNYEGAIAAAEALLVDQPDYAKALSLIDEAKGAMAEQEQKALEVELAQYLKRASVYLEADQLDQAEVELTTILEKNPENGDAQKMLQQIAARRQQIAAEQARLAEQSLKEEEARKMAEAESLFAEAKAAYLAGDVLGAVETWKKVLEIKTDHAPTLEYLKQTEAEYAAGLQEKERQELEQARRAEIEALLNQNVPLLDLKDTDIDNVLSLLGTISGFNIIATEGVEGIITVNIRNKTVGEALEMILIPNGFKYTISEKDITVSTNFVTNILPLSAEAYRKIEKILEDPTSLEDPTQELRRIIYGEVGISTIPGKDLRLNPNTRSLIVTDTEDNLAKVRAFLQDIPEFVEAEEPLESRHYKLDPDSAQQVYKLIELQLYGELGRRSLSADDPRLLVLEEDTFILIVKDTVDRLKEVEATLNNQSLLERLKREELVAKEFRVALEPEPPAGGPRTEWLYRNEQKVQFVVDVLEQMLYAYEGREEAIAKGRRIFRRSQYNLEEDGTITVVDTPENIKKVDNFLSQSQRRGTIVEPIPIKHADINAMLNLLNRVTGRVRTTSQEGGGQVDDSFDRELRLRVSLHADPASQTIIVRAQQQQREQVEAIKDLVAKLDVPVPQVEIESRLVELRMEDSRGLNFDYQFLELFEDRILIDDQDARDTVLNLINTSDQGLSFALGTIGNSKFNFTMSALESLTNAEILSAPKITVISDSAADINIVSNEPYISNVEVNTQGTAVSSDDQLIFDYDQQEVGITLSVTPTVLGDGSVVMDVNPSITTITGRLPVFVGDDTGGSSAALDALGQPITSARTANTRVKVRDGDTLVIGGLIRDEVTKSVDKVPLLGDLPWVGRFFRDTSDTNIKNQLLIFMTVRILPEE